MKKHDSFVLREMPLLLLAGCLLFFCAAQVLGNHLAAAGSTAPVDAVTVSTTNHAIVYPTNFWTVNSTNINTAIGTPIYATRSGYSTNSGYATNAGSATNSVYAGYATNAGYATSAGSVAASGVTGLYNLLTGPLPVGTKGCATPVGEPSAKYATWNGGATLHLLGSGSGSPLTGAGYVDNIEIDLGGSATTSTMESSTIVVYIDGTEVIDMNLQHFFCAHNRDALGGRVLGPIWHTTAIPGGGLVLTTHLAMPFKTSIAIDIVNGDASHSCTVYDSVSYNLTPIAPVSLTQVLYASDMSQNNVAESTSVTLLDKTTTQPGQLAGFMMHIDGGNIVGGYGKQSALEGALLVYVDGSTTPSYWVSGTEDGPNMGYYFSGYQADATGYAYNVGTAIDDCGILYNNPATGVDQFFKLFLRDPIKFNTEIKVVWVCGRAGSQGGVDFTGTANMVGVVWWYQTKVE